MSARFAVLGLARPRTPWFTEVGRWATAGSVPVDFLRCVSVEEVRARLSGGRAVSAVLVDGSFSGLDRDLVHLVRGAGGALLVVDDGTATRDWSALGPDAVLPAAFARDDLVATLEARASAVPAVRALPEELSPGSGAARAAATRRGRLVAVTGAGGTGASLLAMALAQGMGSGGGRRGAGSEQVLLADLALHAEQGMLHGAPDVVPGVGDLVEVHRSGQPGPAGVRAATFEVDGRGYRLLLGLRRHRDWAALRPRAVAAALEGLLATFDVVVADVDADTEGEAECGAVEVEERNVLARTALEAADLVVVVGTAELKGVHALVRTVAELVEFGVDPSRVQAVVNRAPRSPSERSALTRALATLLRDAGSGVALPAAPLHIGFDRRVDRALRDTAPLPTKLGAALCTAVAARLEELSTGPAVPSGAVPVTPGSLGTYYAERAAS